MENPALLSYLKNQIQTANGSIPFSEYMHHVLYAPSMGYYMKKSSIFGATAQEGDFITAPEISSLFGKTLAQVCSKVLAELSHPVILELGAGSGKLAVDVLKELEALNSAPSAYWIFDPSPMLREKQREAIQKHLPHWVSRVVWLEALPEEPFVGVVIANEVLDAMPAQRFIVTESDCFETYVAYENGKFQDKPMPTNDPALKQLAEFIRAQSPVFPYHSERLPHLKSFFDSLSRSLTQGAVFLIDYGFPEKEFYHPDRFMGTLMCHYQQRAHTDPYQHIGEQDITTHVDFTAVAEEAIQADFTLAGYTQQAAFLLNAGLLESMKQANTMANTAIHLLTSPSEMGELFKVMALTKHFDLSPFPGFEHFDKRHTL